MRKPSQCGSGGLIPETTGSCPGLVPGTRKLTLCSTGSSVWPWAPEGLSLQIVRRGTAPGGGGEIHLKLPITKAGPGFGRERGVPFQP